MNILVKVKPRQIFLALTISLGVFLRFYHLGRQSYWMDEGYTINAVLSVLEKGKTILDSGQSYSCATYCYPTAFLVHLLGQGAYTYRLLSALAGSALLFVAYFTTKKIYNRQIALLFTFFLSLSYWQIAWSRQARWYTLLELFTWLAIYYFHHSTNSALQTKNWTLDIGNWRFVAVSIFFLVLAIITQPIVWLTTILLLLFLFVLIARKYRNQTENIVYWKFFFLVIILILLILILLVLISLISPNTGRLFLTDLWHNLAPHYNLPYYLNFYFRNYWIFIFLSLYALTNKKQNQFLQLGLFIFLVNLLAFSFFTNIVHYRYLFYLTPFLYLGGAIGTATIMNSIQNRIYRHTFLILVILLALLSGNLVIWPKSFYALESDSPTKLNRPYYAVTPQPDFNAAYDYIKKNRQPGEIIISSHPQFNKIFLNEPGYWIAYNYLGISDKPDTIIGGKEYYVGASTIQNLDQLESITSTSHGFIVFDFMAQSHLRPEITTFIRSTLPHVFSASTNPYSQIWVYKF